MMNPALIHEDGHRLASLAKVLKANEVPQETVNMILAACCGLPVERVDPRSPYFQWVDEPEEVEAATDATPENETTEERFRRLRTKALSVVEGADWHEGVSILASTMNEVAAPHRYCIKTSLHPLVFYGDDCRK